jgi:predicted metal-dependent phosphoesterase TrpH
MKVDFHTHTTASDGTLTPRELILAAIRSGVEVLALTDHDTTRGLEEARMAARDSELSLVAGAELSVAEPDGEIELHMLGLGMDPANGELQKTLEDLRQSRVRRAERILEKLSRVGAALPDDELPDDTSTFTRPHIARALVRTGHCRNVDDAFNRFLRRGSPAHEPSPGIPSRQAIDTIHAAGGIACLAHPPRSRGADAAGGMEGFIERLVRLGLDGIETEHPSLKRQERKKLRRLARRWNLVECFGSDYHEPSRSSGPGVVVEDQAALDALLERLA